MYIHFVGGFAKAKGALLSDLELIAMQCAKSVYPYAEFIAWTDEASWANLPAYFIKQSVPEADYANWPNYKIEHGQHMSDKIRLMALLSHGGLYIDTDVLCLRPLPMSDKLIVAKQSRNWKSQIVNNGIIYAPEPGNIVLRQYRKQYEIARRMYGWDEHSCRGLYRACKAFPEHCDVRRYKAFHGTGWPVQKLAELPASISDAYFWHLIGPDKQLNADLILDYAHNELGLF